MGCRKKRVVRRVYARADKPPSLPAILPGIRRLPGLPRGRGGDSAQDSEVPGCWKRSLCAQVWARVEQRDSEGDSATY